MKISLWIVASIVCLSQISACLAEENKTAYLDVSGHGFVEAAPDMGMITLTIYRVNTDYETAKQDVDRIVSAAVGVARDAKVEDKDIDSSRVNTRPEYEWIDRKREFRGYRVQRNVQITLRDLSVYGRLLEKWVGVEVTEIGGLQLLFSRREELRNEAIVNAIKSARARAQIMAKELGVKLSGIQRVVESSAHVPVLRDQPVQAFAMRAAPGGGESESVNVGDQRITADVAIVYRVEQ